MIWAASARPVAVKVDELMVVESYAHVHHIVSNVRGRLARRTCTAADVIRGGVPGRHHYRLPQGALHGDHRRAGSSRDAASTPVPWGTWATMAGLDLNILIRSMVVQRPRAELSYRRRHRCRFRSGRRAGRNRIQGARAAAGAEPMIDCPGRRTTGSQCPVDDRGLLYGDHLFETIAVHQWPRAFVESGIGRAWFAAAGILGMTLPDEQRCSESALSVSQAIASVVIRSDPHARQWWSGLFPP
jgi:hypothetical protein